MTWSPPAWSRSAVPRGMHDLPVPQQHLVAILDRQAENYGSRLLLRAGKKERTFEQARDLAAEAASTLARAGIKPGERVAALCANRVELIDYLLGCAWLGAICVPLNIAQRGGALSHALADSGARALLIDRPLVDHLDLVRRPANLEFLWSLDGIPTAGPSSYSFVELPPTGSPLPPCTPHPGDTATILYTSGTTGPAKGVMCSHGQLYWFGGMLTQTLRLAPDAVIYSCLPLFHINALATFMAALMSGATLHLDERFSASRYWQRVIDVHATHFCMLGAMSGMVLAQPGSPAERAHRATTAFVPDLAPAAWEEFVTRFGVEEVITSYASTETNQAIAFVGRRSVLGTMGYVVEGFQARLVDEFDVDVPLGEAGELLLRADHPYAFSTGYFGRPEETLRTRRNFWFHTGDRAVQEPDGRYRFVDRKKDAIRRRGENVSSWEVEQAMLTHPAVLEVAVFGVPSEWGEDDVMAAVVTKPDVQLTPRELIDHLVPLLSRFAIPRYLEFVDSLPHTENGKVRKATLRERGVTVTTWREDATRGAVIAPRG